MSTTPNQRIARMLDSAAPVDRGYLDTLAPGTGHQRRTIASAAMNCRLVSAVYEGRWRAGGLPLLAAGMTMGRELDKAARDLRAGGDQRILDAACGTGNFSRHLAARLTGDGLVVGLDMSEPMLRQAVDRSAGQRVGYVRRSEEHTSELQSRFGLVCRIL